LAGVGSNVIKLLFVFVFGINGVRFPKFVFEFLMVEFSFLENEVLEGFEG
jgi:hypothetical protein